MNDYRDFISWLADHNYVKVTPCSRCHFWRDRAHGDREYSRNARCRRHKIDTHYDDYCSDAVEIKEVTDEHI